MNNIRKNIKGYLRISTIYTVFVVFLLSAIQIKAQAPTVQLALLKYSGGGDWYANPTSLPNLAKYCNRNLDMNLHDESATVEVGSIDIFNYPFVHMTGHGNVVFSELDANNMRNYLLGGGFLHIDDNYGMDPYVRSAMKKVLPELEFVELPFEHEVYHMKYDFKGLPKIHKHDELPSRGYGLIWEGRLICFYSYESDLGDGWEDPSVHKDPPEKRAAALQMGANLVQFAFEQ